jgi:D-alanyl-D-alanine dipeptidase
MTDRAPFQLPAATLQLLVVTADAWDSVNGTLARYEKRSGTWTRRDAWPVSLGLKGLAWGQGLHPAQETGALTAGPQKKEGDLKATAGVFPVGKSYGVGAAAPTGSQWPYQQVDETWRCVDDPTSPSYNQIKPVNDGEKKDFTSAEKMKRADHLYTWVINVEQNSPRVLKGCGSCIFLHVWRTPGSGTEGCTAMPEDKMVELLKWLDPTQAPLLVQMPTSEYNRLKDSWKLP